MMDEREGTQLEQDQADVRTGLGIESGLTAWEVNFLEDMGNRVLMQGRELTEDQRGKVTEILEKNDV